LFSARRIFEDIIFGNCGLNIGNFARRLAGISARVSVPKRDQTSRQ